MGVFAFNISNMLKNCSMLIVQNRVIVFEFEGKKRCVCAYSENSKK